MVPAFDPGSEAPLKPMATHCRDTDDVCIYERGDPRFDELVEELAGWISGIRRCRRFVMKSEGISIEWEPGIWGHVTWQDVGIPFDASAIA